VKGTLLAGIALLLCLGFAPFARAQLTESDTLPLGYRLGLQGNYLRGNVDRLLLLGQADLGALGKKLAFRSANTYQFGNFGPARTENDLLARQFLYAVPDKKIYPYIMVWLESNQRRQLAWRYQVGPGFSARILDKPLHQLKGSMTLTRENGRFRSDQFSDSSYSGSRTLPLWRATWRVAGQHRLSDKTFALRYEAWIQPALNDWQNWRFHGQGAVQAKVHGQLAVQASLQYNSESVVVQGVENADLMVLFGISVGTMP